MGISNIQTIDILSFLNMNSDIANVRFVFEHRGGENKELLGHSLVLACASPVFKTQFYGSISDTEMIVITDASFEVFKIFLDILCNIELNLEDISYRNLGELFYLGEKYQVDDLKKSILKHLNTRKIDERNLLLAARAAEENICLDEFAACIGNLC